MAERTKELITERMDPGGVGRLEDDVAAIQKRVATLPVIEARSEEQILGYDERGLPS